jgi:predicted transcriptional regulator
MRGMSMNIDLPPEVEARVCRLAEESGLTPSAYVRKLVEETVLRERGARAQALLMAWDEEDRTDNPEEIQARSDAWRDFKAAMNESHSSDRILFP